MSVDRSMRGTVLLFILFLFSSISFISTTKYTCDPSSSCGCSTVSTTVTSRIVGGEAASNYTWGWMVSFQQSGDHICGASLLTSEYAVTAAHCIDDVGDDPSILSILVGTNYVNDTSNTIAQRRSIIKMTIHPNYNSETLTNDIAILQFSSLTITSNSKLAFICLPNANQDPFQIGTDLVAIGWGVTSSGSKNISNYLQQVTVEVISSTSPDCTRSELEDSNLQFCAEISTGGKDTCQGDSGGPLMAFFNRRWVLAGITSFGKGCARKNYAGVYTRVSSLISFINSNTNLATSGTTSITQQNINQLIFKGNGIGKSILFLIFYFSFFKLFLFSYE